MIFLNYTACNNIIDSYAKNLTSSYIDQKNEASMAATSVLMFILAAFFFNLNFFSRLSDVSAILNPTVRLFLSSALSIFLPVMSYLFSEAKNEDARSYGGGGSTTELSLRARTILMWMLLVELLRKKVEVILGMQGFSGTIERAARIVWLGILVFSNVEGAGRKAVYGIPWVLVATKLVQRVATSEVGRRSFAYGKNAQLLTSYMAQMLEEQAERGPDLHPQDEHAAGRTRSGSEDLLKMCNYAVMGEENLEKEAGPRRYHLQLNEIITGDGGNSAVVTVGKVWKLAAERQSDPLLQGGRKRLCLSFALYKLLRRRFEDLPITDAETRDCRRLIFKGFCSESEEGTNLETTAVTLFQVIDDEVQFLCEYYHSVHPVMFANSFFFLANYILFPITVGALCILTIVLCSNGDVAYAIHSIKSDNYTISVGFMRMALCLLNKIGKSPPALFSIIDVSISILLLLTFLYEEIWEFVVFILSKWLMVSLLSDYTAKPHLRQSKIFRCVIWHMQWVHDKMSHPNLCFKQFSLLGFCPPLPTKAVAVPKEVKRSILKYLLEHVNGNGSRPLSNGWSALASDTGLRWACESESVAEVILTWHIATSLWEARHPHEKKKKGISLGPDHHRVATTLSKYCAYLVAFHPELLPDEEDGTKRVYKAVKKDLKSALGYWSSYHLSPESTRSRCSKMLHFADKNPPDHTMSRMTVVQKGAVLGKTLIDKAEEGGQELVWKLLADLWTELMVYVAPSSGEVHVKAHKEALEQGGEFVTVLWALATHTGITRPAVAPWEAARRHACV